LGPRPIPQQVVTASYAEGEEELVDAPWLDVNGNKVADGEGGLKMDKAAQSPVRE
jgi:hypothetical protein